MNIHVYHRLRKVTTRGGEITTRGFADQQQVLGLNRGNLGRLRLPDSGKNPLKLGESLPPAVLPGLGRKAGQGCNAKPRP